MNLPTTNQNHNLPMMIPSGTRYPIPNLQEELDKLKLPLVMTEQAMEGRAQIFRYGSYQIMSALTEVAVLKHMYSSMGVLSDIEPYLYQYTQQYLIDMHQISQVAMENIIAELRSFNPDEKGNNLPKLLQRFRGYLTG